MAFPYLLFVTLLCTVLAARVPGSLVADPTLLCRWRLVCTDARCAYVQDALGNGVAAVGNATWQPSAGPLDNIALTLTNGTLSLPCSPPPPATNSTVLAAALWIQLNESSVDEASIISDAQHIFRLNSHHTDVVLRLALQDGSSVSCRAPEALTPGWHLLVATYSWDGHARLVVTVDGTDECIMATNRAPMAVTPEAWTLGSSGWSGALQGLYVFNRELTAVDLAQLDVPAECGNGQQEPGEGCDTPLALSGAVGWWPLDRSGEDMMGGKGFIAPAQHPLAFVTDSYWDFLPGVLNLSTSSISTEPMNLSGMSSVSVAFWVRAASQGSVPVLSVTDGATAVSIDVGGDGVVLNCVGPLPTSTIAPAPSGWTHVAFVLNDTTESAELYINGVSSAGTPCHAAFSSGFQLELHGAPGTLLRDVRLYPTALANSSVVGVFTAGRAHNAALPGVCRPGCVLPTCGDGVLDPNEECDDGNRVSGAQDGCDVSCAVQLGWFCNATFCERCSGCSACVPSGTRAGQCPCGGAGSRPDPFNPGKCLLSCAQGTYADYRDPPSCMPCATGCLSCTGAGLQMGNCSVCDGFNGYVYNTTLQSCVRGCPAGTNLDTTVSPAVCSSDCASNLLTQQYTGVTEQDRCLACVGGRVDNCGYCMTTHRCEAGGSSGSYATGSSCPVSGNDWRYDSCFVSTPVTPDWNSGYSGFGVVAFLLAVVIFPVVSLFLFVPALNFCCRRLCRCGRAPILDPTVHDMAAPNEIGLVMVSTEVNKKRSVPFMVTFKHEEECVFVFKEPSRDFVFGVLVTNPSTLHDDLEPLNGSTSSSQ